MRKKMVGDDVRDRIGYSRMVFLSAMDSQCMYDPGEGCRLILLSHEIEVLEENAFGVVRDHGLCLGDVKFLMADKDRKCIIK